LPQSRVRSALKNVLFIAQLKMKLFLVGDVGVVRIEGLLGVGCQRSQNQHARGAEDPAKTSSDRSFNANRPKKHAGDCQLWGAADKSFLILALIVSACRALSR
jgi:hypothetical protein